MGVDLNRCPLEGRTDPDPGFRANVFAWCWLIEQATGRGWEPIGTTAPDEWEGDEWPGSYGLNDRQHVTAGDAAAWADALEREPTLPYVSDRWGEIVQAFIAYCRGGGFEIW